MLSKTTRDLRLHFYLYRNAHFVSRDDHNDYKEESDYPQASALSLVIVDSVVCFHSDHDDCLGWI
jgi:hypothetical protein